MINTITNINNRIKRTLLGKLHIRDYESEWKEMIRHRNEQAEIAYMVISYKYCNANIWKRLWNYLRYLFYDRHAISNIPEHEIEALARCFLPDIIAYFESDEGKADFVAWKAKQEKLAADKVILKDKENIVTNSCS